METVRHRKLSLTSGVALRPLAVDVREPGFVGALNGEVAQADKVYSGEPADPQALNRYRYSDLKDNIVYVSDCLALAEQG